jgi:FixJ family two-component response regulator
MSGYSDLALPIDEKNPNVGFLSKPFQASGLTARVRDMLSRRREPTTI